MIFEVSPSQIEQLDGRQLVNLLRRLLLAEARSSEIPLRNVAVPLQITVADGGEDGRISWEGGPNQTDFLPRRFVVFQAKRADLYPAGWKAELWTKATQKAEISQKELNEAVLETIEHRGSYIGFCARALPGARKIPNRISEMRNAISDAGRDPSAIDIQLYDANKIATWASQHPSVSLWLQELLTGPITGFLTLDQLARRKDFASIPTVADESNRFYVGAGPIRSVETDGEVGNNSISAAQAATRIVEHLTVAGNSVRLTGPSGVGKSRFVFEMLRKQGTLEEQITYASAIYCDYRTVGDSLAATLEDLVARSDSFLLVVDECPKLAAEHFSEIVERVGSKARLLTIDLDDSPIRRPTCLSIGVGDTATDVVAGIIKFRLPNATSTELEYISNLCGGFPRIAVLATESVPGQAAVLSSVEDLVDRILRGAGLDSSEKVRALEALSLFDRLGADDQFAESFDLVATKLGRMTGDEMFEHLERASRHHLVVRKGRFLASQPKPIATYLGLRRISALRISTLASFIDECPEQLLVQMFRAWRNFDTSPTAKRFADQLLAPDGRYGSSAALQSEHGTEIVDSLVHLAPESVMRCLYRELGEKSPDELRIFDGGRRQIVWALEKLAFRRESFVRASRLMLRLASVESESFSNNATGLFQQFFQLHLSGTEAEPQLRFMVIDENLGSPDGRVVKTCLLALGESLGRHHFSRSGNSNEIGSRAPLKDWEPTLWSEVFDFHRQGLTRIHQVRNANPELSEECDSIISSNIRGLICQPLFEDVRNVILDIARRRDGWPQAIEAIGDWLYFDSAGAPDELTSDVRALYDSLFPTSPIDRAIIYTMFWPGSIRDPDLTIERDERNDYTYATTKSIECANEIAADDELASLAMSTMSGKKLNSSTEFGRALAMVARRPVDIFTEGVRSSDAAGGVGLQLLRGYLGGTEARNSEIFEECFGVARRSSTFSAHLVNLFTSVRITADRITQIVSALRASELAPVDAPLLSYGRALELLSADEVSPLIEVLGREHGSDGVWAGLEILMMYQMDRQALDQRIDALIKELLTSEQTLGETRSRDRDGHVFESLVRVLKKFERLDEDFASVLTSQILGAASKRGTGAYSGIKDSLRKVAGIIMSASPRMFWNQVANMLELATPSERQAVDSLLAGRGTFDDLGRTSGGPLFGLPAELYFDWARENPSARSAFLASFLPLLQNEESGWHWHETTRAAIDAFGGQVTFLAALQRRMHPSGWSGSLVPYFEVYLAPLRELRSHSIAGVREWSDSATRFLQSQIESEKLRDEEDHRG